MATPNGVQRFSYQGPTDFAEYPIVPASLTNAILVGDAVYMDSAAATLRSAGDFPWQGDLASTQRAFAAAFQGFSMDFIPTTTNPAGTFLPNVKCRVSKCGVSRLAIAAATWLEGALVTLAKKAASNFLDPAVAIVSTDPSIAIARALVNSNQNLNVGVTPGTVQGTTIVVEYNAMQTDAQKGQPFFVADPGTGVAIPVTGVTDRFALAANVGAGVETNTIAAGKSGQEFMFTMGSGSGVGSREITFPAAFSGANTKCKVTGQGQFAIFRAAGNGTWGLVVNVGCTLS